MRVCWEACVRREECVSYLQSVLAMVAQVVDAYLTAGDLSTFIIYALYVGGNVGALAGVISNLIQASPLTARVSKGLHCSVSSCLGARLFAPSQHSETCQP